MKLGSNYRVGFQGNQVQENGIVGNKKKKRIFLVSIEVRDSFKIEPVKREN